MSAYCTQTDLERTISSATLIELTDDSGTGTLDTDIMNEMITAASGVVDGYCRKVYHVPFTSPTDFIVRIATQISIHMLFERRAHVFGGIPEWITEVYGHAIGFLKGISKGEIDLGIEPPPTESPAQVAEFGGGDQLFTEDSLEGF